ncbi:Ulp1 protease family, C-terminal catalytic domain [Sesbania bispinosa]|nr:Ulp1 protease family, C-terminal catalytic domain [Sesbania bispinosa]
MASQVGVPDAQTNNKQDRVIVEVSSKDTQSNLQSLLRVKKRKEESGEWNPSMEEICMKKNPLEDRVGNMENQMIKVISSIDLLTQHIVGNKSQNSKYESPKSLIPAVGNECTPVDRNPKDSIERILDKLWKGDYDHFDKDSQATRSNNKFSINDVSVKKLLCSPAMNTPRTVVVSTATPSGFYINSRSNQDNSEPLYGLFVPQSLKAIFKPSKPMYLSKEEAEVASYIFCNNLVTEYDKKEILVATNIKYCDGPRSLLHCLKPKFEIEQDVINLVVCMMTMREKNGLKDPSYWFLPTTYAQFVLAWSTPTPQMIERYYDSFMGKVDLLSKVFIPVNDDNFHWYLIVIDFIQKEIVYLDSSPSDNRKENRMPSVKTLALYMETFLQHQSFYNYQRTPKPLVSKYTVHIPEGLKIQNANSNDCGAWVIMWMVEMGMNDYKIEARFHSIVDEGSRLRITLDLAMNPGNILQEMVKKRAENWMKTLTGDDGGEN